MSRSFVLATFIAPLQIDHDGLQLLALRWLAAGHAPQPPADETGQRLAAHLQAYFDRTDLALDLPVQLRGTPFQQRVWQSLRRIPAGQVRTYGELAAELGSHARAVGMACRRNHLPLVVPCHRVVASNGPGGYDGATGGELLAIKRQLLQHEGGWRLGW